MFTARLHELRICRLWRYLLPSFHSKLSTWKHYSSRNPHIHLRFLSSEYHSNPRYLCAPWHGKREKRCLLRLNQRSFSNFSQLDADPLKIVANSNHATLSRPLIEYSTKELHELMKTMRCEDQRNFNLIYDIIDHLIKVRKERLNTIHYGVLIRANSSAYCGSAESVRDLLKEMDELKIPKDSYVYHNVLLTLSIHPDYILRMEVLSEMKRLWISLSQEGWHHLIIGLIRDRQFELAVEKLEQMLEDRILIEPWLFDIIIYQLCESDEHNEALSILKYRWDHARNKIRAELWHFLLDSFGRASFYEGLKFVWQRQVRSGLLIPSNGMLSMVLNTAARHADPQLAISAVSILSTRSAVEPYHYEALIEAYVRSKDLKSAFRVITIMAKAGLNPDASSTRPLFSYLSSDPKLPNQAWKVIVRSHSEGQIINITAVNVILESCVAQLNIDLTIAIYKNLHTVCSGPNTTTFNNILQGLSKTVMPSKVEAVFLASEMNSLGIKPDELTYDRFILICIREPDYEDAFRYLEEMIREGEGKNEGKGWWLRPGTAQRLVMTTLTEGDARGWEVMAEMKRRGMDISNLGEWAKRTWKNKTGHTVTDICHSLSKCVRTT